MYRQLRTSILGIKKLHKSEEEGGNRRPGFLLKLPPPAFRSSRWLCWLRLPPQSNSLHSALALCYIEAARCSNRGCLGRFGRQWSRGRTRGRTATYYSNVVGRRSRAPRWSVVCTVLGRRAAQWRRRRHWLWDSNSFCSNSKRAHSAHSLCKFYRFLNSVFLAAICLLISVLFYIS